MTDQGRDGPAGGLTATEWQAVLGAVREGVVVHRADGCIVSVNEAAWRILALTRDQLLRVSARLLDADTHDRRVVATFVDVTDERERELGYRVLSESTTDLVALVADGTIRYASSSESIDVRLRDLARHVSSEQTEQLLADPLRSTLATVPGPVSATTRPQ